MADDFSLAFDRSFIAEVAASEALKREAFRLRYQVYCEERGYEESTKFPDGMETDRFDATSVHILVRERTSGIACGVVRMILPEWSGGASLFPLEDVCGHPLFGQSFEDRARLRHDAVEISRFAISGTRRGTDVQPQNRRGSSGDSAAPVGARSAPSSLVALGLIATLFAVSAELDVKVWYALMKESLSRYLSRLGVPFRKIGPEIQYRGRRQPMQANVEQLFAQVVLVNPGFHTLIALLRTTLAPSVAAARRSGSTLGNRGCDATPIDAWQPELGIMSSGQNSRRPRSDRTAGCQPTWKGGGLSRHQSI